VDRVAIIGCGGSGKSWLACLWGITQRRLRHRGGQHAAIGVYDRITWGFILYIASFRKQTAPRIRELISCHAAGTHVVVLRSRRAARRFLAAVVHEQQHDHGELRC
jgi:hypothetical protein